MLGFPSGPVLLTVGRLVPRKGHMKVLEAVQRLTRTVPDLLWVVAGIGTEEAELRSGIERLGLQPYVRLLGKVDQELLPQLYRAADVFVHPNLQMVNGDVEGFGIVFLEANACGLPAIGGASGGVTEAVSHGTSGFLVDPLDPDQLPARVTELLAQRDNSVVAQRCRSWAEQYSWERSAQKLWELTERVYAERWPPSAPQNTEGIVR